MALGLFAAVRKWASEKHPASYQQRCWSWMEDCFEGLEGPRTPRERPFRFLEEAAELCQALGMTERECIAQIKHTFSRPKGVSFQEIGGVLVCLALLCQANGIDMSDAGEQELERCWNNMVHIRAKWLQKPVRVASPASSASQASTSEE